MDDRIHRALDGELPTDQLTHEERLELQRYRATICTALGPIQHLATIDVAREVMHQVAPRGLRHGVGTVLRWLWSPRALSLTVRPAFGMAALAAVVSVYASRSAQTAATSPPRVIVQFRLGAVGAHEVALVGDFNGWRPEHRLHQSRGRRVVGGCRARARGLQLRLRRRRQDLAARPARTAGDRRVRRREQPRRRAGARGAVVRACVRARRPAGHCSWPAGCRRSRGLRSGGLRRGSAVSRTRVRPPASSASLVGRARSRPHGTARLVRRLRRAPAGRGSVLGGARRMEAAGDPGQHRIAARPLGSWIHPAAIGHREPEFRRRVRCPFRPNRPRRSSRTSRAKAPAPS